jgi:hypothetical protein
MCICIYAYMHMHICICVNTLCAYCIYCYTSALLLHYYTTLLNYYTGVTYSGYICDTGVQIDTRYLG